MSEDFEYVRARIPNYRGYESEGDRHESDMRVRAIVGESLSDAHVRLGETMSGDVANTYDELLMQCMFADQVFTRRFEHADLGPEQLAALVASDRAAVELEERVNAATAMPQFGELIGELRAWFAQRARLPAGA